MNAPENIPATNPINLAHEVLLKSHSAMCVDEVTRALGGKTPTKADIKHVAKLLKELADLGLIEMEPRAGGVPFYRLIVAGGQTAPKSRETRAVTGAESGGQIESTEPKADAGIPESEDAPEDCEMPPADPALLAMANRELSEKIESLEAQVAALQESVERERRIGGAINRDLAKLTELLGCDPCYNGPGEAISAINTLRADAEKARTALGHAINEASRLRLELFEALNVIPPAVGYLVKAPKLKPRRVTRPENARAAALAAVRNGAARADVLALVPVGTARRGAEWQGIQPRTKGD